MDWAGRTTTLGLAVHGKRALEGIFEGEFIEVFVQWADDLGLWVLQQVKDEVTSSAVLVRWNHFETAILDVVIEEPQQPKVIGFGTAQSGNRS